MFNDKRNITITNMSDKKYGAPLTEPHNFSFPD